MKRILLAFATLLLGLSEAQAQTRVAAFVVASCPGRTYDVGRSAEVTMDVNGNLCTAASVSASISGFAPGGTFATLTATASSASVALPVGAVVVFQNTGTTAVSCTLGVGSATAVPSQNVIQPASWMAFTVGSNTFGACIDQTGSASNVVVLSGGTGLPTGAGGGSGGGGGGAVTIASGAVASGAYASGSIASGAFASGSIASGALAAGSMVDFLTVRGTKAAGTAAANSLLTGCVYNSGGVAPTDGQQVATQCDVTGAVRVGGGVAAASTTSGQLGSVVMGATTTAPPTNTTAQTNFLSLTPAGDLRVNNQNPYPYGAVPYTATATGTTGATTATLAGAASVTTYICGFSIRANATAAATGNATVTGTITATLNFTQWTAPNASGLGITEMIFAPCLPASAANTSIAVVSAAPGTGGVVSVTAWGYKL